MKRLLFVSSKIEATTKASLIEDCRRILIEEGDTLRTLVVLLLLLVPSEGSGQFLDEENPSASERLAYEKPVQMQVGVVIHAAASPLTGIKCSVPIAIEWP